MKRLQGKPDISIKSRANGMSSFPFQNKLAHIQLLEDVIRPHPAQIITNGPDAWKYSTVLRLRPPAMPVGCLFNQ